jgi:hypothetical protein
MRHGRGVGAGATTPALCIPRRHLRILGPAAARANGNPTRGRGCREGGRHGRSPGIPRLPGHSAAVHQQASPPALCELRHGILRPASHSRQKMVEAAGVEPVATIAGIGGEMQNAAQAMLESLTSSFCVPADPRRVPLACCHQLSPRGRKFCKSIFRFARPHIGQTNARKTYRFTFRETLTTSRGFRCD